MADPTWDSTNPTAQGPQGRGGPESPTWESTQSLEEKYGGAPGAAKAFGLGAARSASFGGSDWAITHLGLSTPEEIKAYEEQNPNASIAGEIAGIGGALVAPEVGLLGAAAAPVKAAAKIGGAITKAALPAAEAIGGAAINPAIGKILGQAGAHALGSAAEGSFYTLGHAVSEKALGDPDAFGEKLVANLGTNAIISGALGSMFGAVKGGLGFKAIAKTQAQAVSEHIPGIVTDAPKTGVQPTSLQDIEEKVAQAKYAGNAIELPQKGVLEDALTRVELDNPVHPLQVKSLENQGARDLYNTFKDTQGKTGDTLRGYEALQKNELLSKTSRAISELSPGLEPTTDAVEGGNRAIKAFTDQYQAEKNELSPVFNELKSKPIGDKGDVLTGMVQKMTDAVPGVSKMFDTEGSELSVIPYKTSWGIDKATYNAVKEAADALKENPSDFESLANIRRGLDQHVDVLAQGQAPAQIRSLKAAMMDFMQDEVQRVSPDVKVRDAFKRWAINEQERNVIEKAFGASVGSSEFGAISKIKPEMVGDKIFANTASVQAAKNILSKDKFNEILANWLSEAKQAATDKGSFSSNKFGSFLRKNQDALNAAFADNPSGLQKLNDLTTVMRILPDAPPINPSGTAKTLYNMLKGFKLHDVTWEGMLAAIPKKVLEAVGEQRQLSQLGDELAGKSAQVDSLSLVERAAAKTTRSINSAASGIFSSDAKKSIPAVAPILFRKENHDKLAKKLSDLSDNSEKLIDHLNQNTAILSQFAPQTSHSAQGTMARATQFLQSKLPGNNIQQKPLSPKYKPSDTELSKWHKYFSTVDHPIGALYQVASGTITSETMEALNVVYPKLLSEMQASVMDKMTESISKGKMIPYRTKLALSMFLDQDLVNSLDSGSMLATQNVMSTATQAKQMQENQMTNGANKKGIGKITKPNRLLTSAQASAERKEA